MQKMFIPVQPNIISQTFFYIFPETLGNIGLDFSQLNVYVAGILLNKNTTTNFRQGIFQKIKAASDIIAKGYIQIYYLKKVYQILVF